MILAIVFSCFLCWCQATRIVQNIALLSYGTLKKDTNELKEQHASLLLLYKQIFVNNSSTDSVDELFLDMAKSFEQKAGASESSSLVPIHKLLRDALMLRKTFVVVPSKSMYVMGVGLMETLGKLARSYNFKLDSTHGVINNITNHETSIAKSSLFWRAFRHVIQVYGEYLCDSKVEQACLPAIWNSFIPDLQSSMTIKAFCRAELIRKTASKGCPGLEADFNNPEFIKWDNCFNNDISDDQYLCMVKRRVCQPVKVDRLPFELLSSCELNQSIMETMILIISDLRLRIKACKNIVSLFSLIKSYKHVSLGSTQSNQRFNQQLNQYLRLQMLGESSSFTMNPVRHARFFSQHNQFSLLEDLGMDSSNENLEFLGGKAAVSQTLSIWAPKANARLYCSSMNKSLPPILLFHLDELGVHIPDSQRFASIQYLHLKIESQLQKFVIETFNGIIHNVVIVVVHLHSL